MFADIHAHLRGDLDASTQRAEENNVKLIITSGADLQSSIDAINISKRYEIVYASIGFHPWNADKLNQKSKDRLRNLTLEEKVVAIGEIGLDFIKRINIKTRAISEPLPKEIQIKTFQNLVTLAKEANLPLILHSNAAHHEVLEILEKENASEVGGAIHGFNGDTIIAQQYINLGFHITIGRRAITTPDNTIIQEVAKKIPLEKLLMETDSNDPANVLDVAEKLAKIKGTSIEEVGRKTTQNLRSLLGM
jgi:TatD DNase family protein